MTSGEVTEYVPLGEGPSGRPIVSDLDDVLHLRQLVPDALHLVQLLLVIHHEDVGPFLFKSRQSPFYFGESFVDLIAPFYSDAS